MQIALALVNVEGLEGIAVAERLLREEQAKALQLAVPVKLILLVLLPLVMSLLLLLSLLLMLLLCLE
ncbi:hypothetical protein ACSSS7_006266 [Eimeria intestinalis]